MARARKVHRQLDLYWGDKNGQRRGDKQRRRRRTPGVKLGRPPRGDRSSERHETRRDFKPNQPLHVTLRVVGQVGYLRTAAMYKALREAAHHQLANERCRIVHLSIQGNHVHLLVEADDRHALATGIKGFEVSAAKHINAAVGAQYERRGASLLGRSSRRPPPLDLVLVQGRRSLRRKGQVFADRYHVEIITSPRQARRALAYVLNNWRRHRADRDRAARAWKIDPFSTGWSFDGWRERADTPFVWPLREAYQAIHTWRPQTWLLAKGWRRHGLVGTHEVPGAR